MRLSRYFLPVLKENPAEAQIVSHRYMLRAGMIKQQAAGIYSWLPLGYRVLKRIEEIVHQEQIRAGHIPLLMPTIQPADLWRESGRYGDYGEEMLRITDRQKRELLFGPTNEEMITDIFRAHGPAWRRTHAGHVSLTQLKVMSSIEACRTEALGGHVAGCAKCGHLNRPLFAGDLQPD